MPLNQTLNFNATTIGGFSEHIRTDHHNSTQNYHASHHSHGGVVSGASPNKGYIILSPPVRGGSNNATSSNILALNFEVFNNGMAHRQIVEEYEGRLSSHDDHLKSAMNALNEKLKFYENIELEKSHVLDQLAMSEKMREDLRSTLVDASEKSKEEQDKNFKYQEILINENQSLSKQILIITDMFSKKVEEYDDLKQSLSLKEKETHSLQLEKADLLDYKVKYLRECAQKEDLYQKFC